MTWLFTRGLIKEVEASLQTAANFPLRLLLTEQRGNEPDLNANAYVKKLDAGLNPTTEAFAFSQHGPSLLPPSF